MIISIFWGGLHQILRRFIRLPKRLRNTVTFEVQEIKKYTYHQCLLYGQSFKEVLSLCKVRTKIRRWGWRNVQDRVVSNESSNIYKENKYIINVTGYYNTKIKKWFLKQESHVLRKIYKKPSKYLCVCGTGMEKQMGLW